MSPTEIRSPSPVVEVDPKTPSRDRPVEIARQLERSTFSGSVLEELVHLLKSSAASAEMPGEKQLYAALLRTLQNDGVKLPTMPKTVLKIQRIIDSPNCDAQALTKVLARDPVVTTKVVGIANSALYRTVEPVRGLREAIVRIGLRETRNVVMAIVAQSKLFRVPGFEEDASRLYQHTLATSVASQMIGQSMGINPDEAFLAGLVHDLGEVVLLSIASDIGRRSRDRETIDPVTLAFVSDRFHAQLSATIAQAWNFSNETVEAILYHHQIELASGAAALLARAIHEADVVADRVTGNLRRAEGPTENPPSPLTEEPAESLLIRTKERYADLVRP